jgi:hypothetical protein
VISDENDGENRSTAAGSSAEAVEDRGGHATAAARPPLARFLADAGVASEQQLRMAVAEGMDRGERLGEVVLRRGWIDEAGLAQLLARQWDLAYVDVGSAVVEPGARRLLAPPDAERLRACVIGVVKGVPLVGVAEPTEARFESVRSALGGGCEFAVVTKSALERLLTQLQSDEANADTARTEVAAHNLRDEAEAERVASELDAFANTLLAWAERIRRITEIQRQTGGALAEAQRQIDALHGELASERSTIERLEAELAHQREPVSTAKAKLGDLARALEAD